MLVKTICAQREKLPAKVVADAELPNWLICGESANWRQELSGYSMAELEPILVDLVKATWFTEPNLLDQQALAGAVRLGSQKLAGNFPGKTIEVRVPPYSAVQVGLASEDSPLTSSAGQSATGLAAPSHTRGTPPNVVEMAGETFLQLAIGATSWADLMAVGQIKSSGVHANQVGQMFPIWG